MLLNFRIIKSGLLLMFLFGYCSFVQSENMFKRNKAFGFGIGYTKLNYSDDISDNAIGGFFNLYGVYLEGSFGGLGGHRNSVEVKKWDDEKDGYCIHVGYQIPLCKYFRITPIVGYTSTKIGETDGYHWSVGDGHIYNSYNTRERVSGIDYGAISSVLIENLFVVYGTITNRIFSVGIGFDFSF